MKLKRKQKQEPPKPISSSLIIGVLTILIALFFIVAVIIAEGATLTHYILIGVWSGLLLIVGFLFIKKRRIRNK